MGIIKNKLTEYSDSDTIQLITPKQLSERLNVSPAWISKAAKKGLIPSYHLGRCLRFKLSDIQRYLQETERGNGKGVI